MKQFKLTIKSDDTELVKKIMYHLRKDFELLDEPEECNRTLEDYLSDINRGLKDLALLVGGNDFPSTVKALEGLKLVGDRYMKDDFCTNCGSPEWYYTGGRKLCGNCEHSERADSGFEEGDITDYSGFVTLDRNQIR